MNTNPTKFLAVTLAGIALALPACEKTQDGQNGSGQNGNSTEAADAGFDAVHDLVIELIRRREFNAALVGIDHMEDMSDEVSEDKARQVEALRAALTVAQSGPASEPPPAPRIDPFVEPDGG